jgi:hypothetical protein
MTDNGLKEPTTQQHSCTFLKDHDFRREITETRLAVMETKTLLGQLLVNTSHLQKLDVLEDIRDRLVAPATDKRLYVFIVVSLIVLLGFVMLKDSTKQFQIDKNGISYGSEEKEKPHVGN